MAADDDLHDDPEDDRLRTSLGKAIAIRRVELGLKRNDLRDRSGLSYPYIAELENGAKRASSKALAAVARALELSPSELLARAEFLEAGASPRVGSFDDAELEARRSWFRAAVAPAAASAAAAAAAAMPPTEAAASPPSPPPAATPAPARGRTFARRQDATPLTEERVREIVREELRAAGLLPPDRRRRGRS